MCFGNPLSVTMKNLNIHEMLMRQVLKEITKKAYRFEKIRKKLVF
jgi:hypothetical protein